MKNKIPYLLSVLFSVSVIVAAFVYSEGEKGMKAGPVGQSRTPGGVILPVRWGDFGAKMIESGVIDADKFEAVYRGSGGLSGEKNLLYGRGNGSLEINAQNSGYVLNLLWALGLGNKNEILEQGEMTESRYGGAGNFASTAGWTASRGSAANHYSRHNFIALTATEQDLVNRVSQNIYRPCCDNSTHFPDCNHGMAMLGLLELMASQGVSESDMYKYALEVNKLWFPDTYAAIKRYLGVRGLSLETADPEEILGQNYSSLAGYESIIRALGPTPRNSGSSCGVTNSEPPPPSQNLNGPSCGI